MGCCKKDVNIVEEADQESFPAGDPPAWTLGREAAPRKDKNRKAAGLSASERNGCCCSSKDKNAR